MNLNSIEQRLIKYIKKQENGCWLWTGTKNHSDGVLTINKKTCSVKRILYGRFYPFKEIKPKENLQSICKVPFCVNPEHQLNKEDHFLSQIKKNENTECWEWTGFLKGGYGYIRVNRKDFAVHRLMFERYKRPIPKNVNVCHSCDNTKCCNPEHLWLGTQQENIKDMINKKRDKKAFGTKHHRCKINEEIARQIKIKFKEGLNMREIHRTLNISYRIVQHICTGNTWRHINI